MFNTAITHVVSLVLLTSIAVYTYDSIGDLYAKFAAFCSLLYISFLLASFVDNVLPRFRVTAANKAVLITGCDTGFGHLLARRLDSMGFKVFAGCLDPAGKGAGTLKYTSSRNLQILRLDVTDDESVKNALKVVENNLENCKLWAVVNNAGVIERGEAEWMPLDAYKKQFEVNTFGVVRVTQAFLPLLRKTKGRIVTTTSVGGRQSFSGFVPYCMSKYATLSFCEGLRLEMAKFGVKVITVEPFSFKTNMTDMSVVLKSVRDIWEKSPATNNSDVYDLEYLEEFSESVRKYNEGTALPDVHRVINWLVDGVCAISPHYSYFPGDLKCFLGLWFIKRMPKTFADYLVRKTITHDCEIEKHLAEKAARKKIK